MNQKGGSRTETLVKLVLIFVISLLSFSVGTFVGKQFSDSQYKMANLENEFHGERSTASAKEETHHDNALTDEDIASLTEEFVNAEREAVVQKDDGHGEHAEPTHAAPTETAKHEVETHHETVAETHPAPAKKMETKAHDTVAHAAERVAEDKSPTKAHVDRTITSLPKFSAADTIGKYTVQVASYATKGEAEAHAKTLVDSGLNAFSVSADIKGKTWYRVSVGLFGTRQSANDYKDQLLKQAQLKSAIVQKITQ